MNMTSVEIPTFDKRVGKSTSKKGKKLKTENWFKFQDFLSIYIYNKVCSSVYTESFRISFGL